MVVAAADGDAVEQIVAEAEAVPQDLIIEVGTRLERLRGGPAGGGLSRLTLRNHSSFTSYCNSRI